MCAPKVLMRSHVLQGYKYSIVERQKRELSYRICRMMAQHVGYSLAPVTFLLVFGIFHLANGVSLKFNGVVLSNIVNSVRLIDPNVELKNTTLYNVDTEVKTASGLFVEVGFKEPYNNYEDDLSLSWSPNDQECDDKYGRLRKLSTSRTGNLVIYKLPDHCCFEVTDVYFCLGTVTPHGHSPYNLGGNFAVRLLTNDETPVRSSRDNGIEALMGDAPASDPYELVRIEGIRVETAEKEPLYTEEGIPEILTDSPATLRLFGTGITKDTVITFTDIPQERGTICDKIKTKEFAVRSVEKYTALIDVNLPLGSPFFICVKQGIYDNNHPKSQEELFKHQGVESYNVIRTYKKNLPLWLSILIILTCLSFSALFSGLNLGLMAMDRTELKILCNTGTEQEKKYARIIQPVRNRGNYLLCSILFSNVLVNSLFTILLDDLTSGLVAVICSTLAIVIFGEISPQAFCSRHGLCVGAKTIFVTKCTMVLTFPLSYPISKLLDFMLGEEIGNVYNRERLKELVRVTTGYNDLEKDEVNIISGALELRKKTVADVMTRIEDVYMLDYDAILDFETVSEIMKSGFSRIPVYEGARTNIITMLYIKDLAFVDPDDNTPLRTLCQFYQNPCNFVFEDVTLDIMFKQFKEGHKGHMAFVQRVNNEGEGDPFYEVIGLVTLEDVIEELIQAEIMDETDVFTDNRSKRKRLARPRPVQDFTVFAEKKENQRIHISPQLTLAMFQYLSTIDPFKPNTISETILRRLLKQDIIYHIKVKNREKARNDPAAVIYQQGKPVDYFVLILEGRVEVTVGKENLMFESGPFTYFGQQALSTNVVIAESPTNANPQTLGSIQSVNLDAILRHTFVPDYTVRAITEVFYVKVKRSLYLAAKRATLLDKSQKDSSQDQFDDEVEKLLHSLDEDDRSVLESPTLSRKDYKDKDASETQNSPRKSVTAPTSPVPVSASPVTNSKFISTRTGHNGKLKTSPAEKIPSPPGENTKSNEDSEVTNRQIEASRLSGSNNHQEIEETTNLLPKQERS
ncbi:unextended protein isoform X2 [Venturia canescens]|uniref:unextended protein isoform X2 n=1 Tax=Venturia canescens TaxID=32260 RepID=UPI001C9CD0E5|nr:unextended protein isoform X2 [Venturia canescens]